MSTKLFQSPLNEQNLNERIVLLFRVMCCMIFIGRAWQLLVFDAPLRAVLWDPHWMRGIVKSLFGMEWHEWATDLSVDHAIVVITRIWGIFYLLFAVAAVAARPGRKWLYVFLYAAALSGAVLAFLYCKEKWYHLGQFFEYAIQIGTPLFVIGLLRGAALTGPMRYLMLGTVGLTFAAHGMYAFGLYPVPGHFVDMTILSLGVAEETARALLKIAGFLDFGILLLIWVPQVRKYVLYYAVFWGLLTAFARVWAWFDADLPLESLNQWWYQTVYRLPHGLLPLAVLMAEGYPPFRIRKEEVPET